MRKWIALLLVALLFTACSATPATKIRTATIVEYIENHEYKMKSDLFMWLIVYGVDLEDEEDLTALRELQRAYTTSFEDYLVNGTEPENWNGTDILVNDWSCTNHVAEDRIAYKETLDEMGIRVISSEFWGHPADYFMLGRHPWVSVCFMETLTYEQDGQVYEIDIHHSLSVSSTETAENSFTVWMDDFLCPVTSYETGENHTWCDAPGQHTHNAKSEPRLIEP